MRFFKESDYRYYARRKQQLNDRARDNARISMEMMKREKREENGVDEEEEEVVEEEEEEEEEITKHKTNSEIKTRSRLGLCTVCHLSVADKTYDETCSERTPFWSQGHLLCRRCIDHFAIQSGQRHVTRISSIPCINLQMRRFELSTSALPS